MGLHVGDRLVRMATGKPRETAPLNIVLPAHGCALYTVN
jgi:hypothetical protein